MSNQQRLVEVRKLYKDLSTKANQIYTTKLQTRLASLRSTYRSGLLTLRQRYGDKIQAIREKNRDRILITVRNTTATDLKNTASKYGFALKRFEYIKSIIGVLRRRGQRAAYVVGTLGYGDLLKNIDKQRNLLNNTLTTKLQPELDRIAPNITKATEARIKLEEVDPQLTEKTAVLQGKRIARGEAKTNVDDINTLRIQLPRPDFSTFPGKSAKKGNDAKDSAGTADKANTELGKAEQRRNLYGGEVTKGRGRLKILQGSKSTAITTFKGRLTGKLTSTDGGVADIDIDRVRAVKSRENAAAEVKAKKKRKETVDSTLLENRTKQDGFDIPSRRADEFGKRTKRDNDADARNKKRDKLAELGLDVPPKKKARDSTLGTAEEVRPTPDPQIPLSKARQQEIQTIDTPANRANLVVSSAKRTLLQKYLDSILGPKRAKILKDLETTQSSKGTTATKSVDLSEQKKKANKDKKDATDSKEDTGTRRQGMYNRFKLWSTRSDISKAIYNKRNLLLFGSKLDLEVKQGRKDRLTYDAQAEAKQAEAGVSMTSGGKRLGNTLSKSGKLGKGFSLKMGRLSKLDEYLSKLVPVRNRLITKTIPDEQKNRSDIDAAKNLEDGVNTEYKNKATTAREQLQEITPNLDTKSQKLGAKKSTRAGLFKITLPKNKADFRQVRNGRNTVRVDGHKTDSETADVAATRERGSAIASEAKRQTAVGNAEGYSILVRGAGTRLDALFSGASTAKSSLRIRIRGMLVSIDGSVGETGSARTKAFGSRAKAAADVEAANTKLSLTGKLLGAVRGKKPGQSKRVSDVADTERILAGQRDTDGGIRDGYGGRIDQLGSTVPGKRADVENASIDAENIRPTPDVNLPRWKARRSKIRTEDSPRTSKRLSDAAADLDGQKKQYGKLVKAIETNATNIAKTTEGIENSSTTLTNLRNRKKTAKDTKADAEIERNTRQGRRPTAWLKFTGDSYRRSASFSILSARQRLILLGTTGKKTNATLAEGRKDRPQKSAADAAADMVAARMNGVKAAKRLGLLKMSYDAVSTSRAKKAETHRVANEQIEGGKLDLDGDQLGMVCKGGTCSFSVKRNIELQNLSLRKTEIKLALEANSLRDIDTDIFARDRFDVDPELNRIDMDLFSYEAVRINPDLANIDTDLFTRGPLKIDETLGVIDPSLFDPPNPTKFQTSINALTNIRNGAAGLATRAGKQVQIAEGGLGTKIPQLSAKRLARSIALKLIGDAQGARVKTARIRGSVEVDGHSKRSREFEVDATRERGSAKRSGESITDSSGKRDTYHGEVTKAQQRAQALRLEAQALRNTFGTKLGEITGGADGGVARIRSALDTSFLSRRQAEIDLDSSTANLSRIDTDLFTVDSLQPPKRTRIEEAQLDEGTKRKRRDDTADTFSRQSTKLNEQRSNLPGRYRDLTAAQKAKDDAYPFPDSTLPPRRASLESTGLNIDRFKSLLESTLQAKLELQRSLKALQENAAKNGEDIALNLNDIGNSASKLQALRDLRKAAEQARGRPKNALENRQQLRKNLSGTFRRRMIQSGQSYSILGARKRLLLGIPTRRPEDVLGVRDRKTRADPTLEFDKSNAEYTLRSSSKRFGVHSLRRNLFEGEFESFSTRHRRANTRIGFDVPSRKNLDGEIEAQYGRRNGVEKERNAEILRRNGYKKNADDAESVLRPIPSKLGRLIPDLAEKRRQRKNRMDDLDGYKNARTPIRKSKGQNDMNGQREKSYAAFQKAKRERDTSDTAEGYRGGSISKADLFNQRVQLSKGRLKQFQAQKSTSRTKFGNDVTRISGEGEAAPPRLKGELDSAFSSRIKSKAELDASIKRMNDLIKQLEAAQIKTRSKRSRVKEVGEVEGQARLKRDTDADARTKLGESLGKKYGGKKKARGDADAADTDAKNARPKGPADMSDAELQKQKLTKKIEAIKKQRDAAIAKRRALEGDAEGLQKRRKQNGDAARARRKSKRDAEDADANTKKRKRDAEEEANARRKKRDDANGKKKNRGDGLTKLSGLLAFIGLLLIGMKTFQPPKPPPPIQEPPPEEEVDCEVNPDAEGCKKDEEKEPDCEADPEAEGCEIDEDDPAKGEEDGYRQGKIDGLKIGSSDGRNEVLSLFGISEEDIENERTLKQKLQAITIQLRNKLIELQKETEGITHQEFCTLLSNELAADKIPLEEVYPSCLSPQPQAGGQITKEVDDPLDGPQSKYDTAYTKAYNKAYKMYYPIGNELGKRLGVGYLKLNAVDGKKYKIIDLETIDVDDKVSPPNLEGGGGTFRSLKRALAAFNKRRGVRRGSTLTAGQSLLNRTKGKTTSLQS